MNKQTRKNLAERAAEIIKLHGGKVSINEHESHTNVNAAFAEVSFSFDFWKHKSWTGNTVHWYGAKRNLDAHNSLFESVNTCHWRKATAYVIEDTLVWEDYLYRAGEAAKLGAVFQKEVA